MTLKDKLEIGLEEDAPFRTDNLPEDQVEGPLRPAGDGRSPEVPAARERANRKAGIPPRTSPDRRPPEEP